MCYKTFVTQFYEVKELSKDLNLLGSQSLLWMLNVLLKIRKYKEVIFLRKKENKSI